MSQKEELEKRVDPALEGLFTIPSSPSENSHLVGSKCKFCQGVLFPKGFICPNCYKEDGLEEVALSRKGKLYTYCIVRVAPLGFTAPYAIGYVDLPERLRIFSMLTECDPKKLKIGMDVELVIEKIREDEEGRDLIGYKFKPIQ